MPDYNRCHNVSSCPKQFLFNFRRVHITQATLEHLHGEYEVEPGNGHLRDQYLREQGVQSYFIVPPPRRRKPLLFNTLHVSHYFCTYFYVHSLQNVFILDPFRHFSYTELIYNLATCTWISKLCYSSYHLLILKKQSMAVILGYVTPLIGTKRVWRNTQMKAQVKI